MLTGGIDEQTTADHPLDPVFHHSSRLGVSFSFLFEIGLSLTQSSTPYSKRSYNPTITWPIIRLTCPYPEGVEIRQPRVGATSAYPGLPSHHTGLP